MWSKQDYQDDSRGTYLEYRNEAIYLITNAEGSSSSIYADISPLNANIEFDVDNYDYFIECEIDNRNGRDYKLELVGSSSNVALLGDGWNNVAFEINNVYTATYPLTVVNETANRLIGIQIKKGSMPLTLETDSGSIKIKIVREPKA